MSLTIKTNTNFNNEKINQIAELKNLSKQIKMSYKNNIENKQFARRGLYSHKILDGMSTLKNMLMQKINQEQKSSLINIASSYFENYFKLYRIKEEKDKLSMQDAENLLEAINKKINELKKDDPLFALSSADGKNMYEEKTLTLKVEDFEQMEFASKTDNEVINPGKAAAAAGEAAEEGLMVNDKVIKIGDKDVSETETAFDICRNIKNTYQRTGEKKEITFIVKRKKEVDLDTKDYLAEMSSGSLDGSDKPKTPPARPSTRSSGSSSSKEGSSVSAASRATSHRARATPAGAAQGEALKNAKEIALQAEASGRARRPQRGALGEPAPPAMPPLSPQSSTLGKGAELSTGSEGGTPLSPRSAASSSHDAGGEPGSAAAAGSAAAEARVAGDTAAAGSALPPQKVFKYKEANDEEAVRLKEKFRKEHPELFDSDSVLSVGGSNQKKRKSIHTKGKKSRLDGTLSRTKKLKGYSNRFAGPSVDEKINKKHIQSKKYYNKTQTKKKTKKKR
jgi:hypothetical protein